jgi:hypothetical protein
MASRVVGFFSLVMHSFQAQIWVFETKQGFSASDTLLFGGLSEEGLSEKNK